MGFGIVFVFGDAEDIINKIYEGGGGQIFEGEVRDFREILLVFLFDEFLVVLEVAFELIEVEVLLIGH